MTTTVINVGDLRAMRKAVASGLYTYCGRGGPWGNRHEIGRDITREQAIALHKAEFIDDPSKRALVIEHLKDRILGCYCKPKACHCDTYVEICDGE